MRARQRHLNQKAAGAALVLDSRRMTGFSDGDAVGQWDDVSGSGWNVTQSDNAKKPTYKTAIQGGQPVVRADGGDRLISSSVSVSQSFSGILVFKVSTADTDGAGLFDSYNNTQCVLYTGPAVDFPTKFVIASGSTAFELGDRNNNWNIISVQCSGATSYGGLNGAKNTATSTIGSNGLNGISLFDIRGNPNPIIGQYAMNGDLGQVVIRNSAMEDPMRKRLEHSAALSFKIACS